MKQYCRYCSFCVVGDIVWCSRYAKTIKESTAKSINNCSGFELNPMDAFFENERGYKPREPKKEQCDGQIELFGKVGVK